MSEACPQGGTGEAAVSTAADSPSRPRPKVLIPPVAARMPADPPRDPASPAPAEVRVGAPPPGKVVPVQEVTSASGRPAQTPPKGSTAAGSASPRVAPAAPKGAVRRPSEPASLASPAPTGQKPSNTTPPVVRTVRPPASRPGVARVFLTHLDPWSVMKQAFLLSLGLAVVLLVAVAALWFAMDSAGVFDALTRTASEVGGQGGSAVGGFLSFSKVMGVALLLAGIETILTTALITLFAFMYNLAVGIGGGLEITLSEQN